ncbi:MAG: sugar porter family MFS transporter [Bacilli bacterium]|nr:sugar porter family MFS transporter [Bacilli bacterium]
MNSEKLKLRQQKELARLQKEKAKPKRKIYIWYLILILTLIYIVDEVATNSTSELEDVLMGVLFPGDSANIAASNFSIISTIALIVMILAAFYKPLADRFGRKPFLVINTLGMALAMGLCSIAVIAHNFIIYALGFILLKWFVTPDEQVVYIFETSPKKWRATIYSVIKGIAEFGLFLIPFFRSLFISSSPDGVRYIFLTIAIIAAVAAFLALLFARESDAFLDERIAYLSLSEEEKERLRQKRIRNKKQQGGLIHGLAYCFTHKQLLFILVATLLYTLARVVTDKSTAILAIEGYSTDLITAAQFILPIGAGVLTLVYGLFSDKVGRKITIIVMLALCTIFFGGYVLSFKLGWNIYVVGLFMGLYLAAYWGTGDTFIMMAGESSPTNLRASNMSVLSLFYGMGQVISGVIASVALRFIGESNTWLFLLILALPCFFGSIFVTMFLVKETKGIEIETVDKEIDAQLEKEREQISE